MTSGNNNPSDRHDTLWNASVTGIVSIIVAIVTTIVNQAFFTPPPTLSGIAIENVTQGEKATIIGSNFTGNGQSVTLVSFDGPSRIVRKITIKDDGEIEFQVPDETPPGRYQLQVTLNDGRVSNLSTQVLTVNLREVPDTSVAFLGFRTPSQSNNPKHGTLATDLTIRISDFLHQRSSLFSGLLDSKDLGIKDTPLTSIEVMKAIEGRANVAIFGSVVPLRSGSSATVRLQIQSKKPVPAFGFANNNVYKVIRIDLPLISHEIAFDEVANKLADLFGMTMPEPSYGTVVLQYLKARQQYEDQISSDDTKSIGVELERASRNVAALPRCRLPIYNQKYPARIFRMI